MFGMVNLHSDGNWSYARSSLHRNSIYYYVYTRICSIQVKCCIPTRFCTSSSYECTQDHLHRLLYLYCFQCIFLHTITIYWAKCKYNKVCWCGNILEVKFNSCDVSIWHHKLQWDKISSQSSILSLWSRRRSNNNFAKVIKQKQWPLVTMEYFPLHVANAVITNSFWIGSTYYCAPF